MESCEIDSTFEPFTGQGMISINGLEEDQVPVTWLRDTGTAQSFILESALPFSRETYCGSDVLVQGIEMGVLKVPLHTLYIRSELITGFVKVAVRKQLPVTGVTMIIGNDLAGGKVLPIPEVIENPLSAIAASSKDVDDLTVFPACVLLEPSYKEFPNVIDLSDSTFVDKMFDPVSSQPEVSVSTPLSPVGGADADSVDLLLSIDRTTFAAEQKQDSSLACCKYSAVTREDIASKPIGYFYEDGVLMRKWTPSTSDNSGWDTIYQMVVPKCFREQVMSVAHDNVAGHLGVTKTLLA